MDGKGLYIVTGSKIRMPETCGARLLSPMNSALRSTRSRRRTELTRAITTSRSETDTKLREPDGSFGLPLLGESREWLKDLSIFFAERYHTVRRV